MLFSYSVRSFDSMTYLIAYGFVSGANIPSNATTHAVHVAHIFIKPIRSIQEPRVLKCLNNYINCCCIFGCIVRRLADWLVMQCIISLFCCSWRQIIFIFIMIFDTPLSKWCNWPANDHQPGETSLLLPFLEVYETKFKQIINILVTATSVLQVKFICLRLRG